MHKNCCHQSCSFWLRYAPNRLSAGASPQTPLRELTALPQASWFRGCDPRGKGRREGRREGKGGEEKEGRESRNAQMQIWKAYWLVGYAVFFLGPRSNPWMDFHGLAYGSYDVFSPKDGPFGVCDNIGIHLGVISLKNSSNGRE